MRVAPRRWSWVIGWTLFASWTAVAGTSGPSRAPASWDLNSPHRTDRVLVIPRDDVPPAQLDRWCDDHAAPVLRRHPALDGLRVVQTPPGMPLESFLQKLDTEQVAAWVEPDYLIRPTLTPDDPAFVSGVTWNLESPQTSGGVNPDLDVADAWEAVHDASSVIVAIIDSGVRATHEDLAVNLWTNPGEIPGNGIDDDGNGVVDDVHDYNAIADNGDVQDEVGHGTHVAGIIGAVGNNGRGTVGVAWSVRLMPLKFIPASGEGATSDAIACLDYAIAQGARIINASWGSTARSTALRRAIDRARAAGIAVVAASGNAGANLDRTPFYPAAYTADNLVSVAASDKAGALADFSNYGATSVDLTAPGVAIYSTWNAGDSAYSQQSGTSMAAPHVTGVLALLAAFCGECTYSQLIGAVLHSVDPLPSLAGKVTSGGRLNAAHAVSGLASAVLSPPTLTVTRVDGAVGLVVRLEGTPNATYWIEVSAELQTWNRLVQVTADSSGQASVTLGSTTEPFRFCRATAGVSSP